MGRFGSHLLNRASCHGFGSSPSDPNLMSQAEFFHVRCGRCCLGKGTRLSPQTAMRGLRASRAAAALALAVMAACLAPCGVGASGFDAAAQGRARARETHRHRRAPIAPRLTSLSPPSAHVSGGAVLTLGGAEVVRTTGAADADGATAPSALLAHQWYKLQLTHYELADTCVARGLDPPIAPVD